MSETNFPTDIKQCMKDCLLALLWPRKDIFGFLRDHGCTSSDLEPIRSFKEQNFARGQMIDVVFDRLAERADGGLGQFRSMLQALTQWTRFDPYYFDNLRKLDRPTAERHLNHLKQLVEIRDSKIRAEQKRREAAQAAASSEAPLHTLLDRFLDLFHSRGKPQERGYKFESLLRDIANREKLEMTGPFRCTGEQIDGGLKYDGENYLVEAKWHDKSASTEPLYTFAGKIEGKMYGRGVFVSVNGYMPEPVKALVTGKAIKTVLIDGEDLTLVLEGQLTFRKMLDEKIRAAQLKGQIYVHPLTGQMK